MFSNLSPIPLLPDYPGPYKVGTAEFEIPISEIASPTPVPNPEISSIKFRVFYPTLESAKSRQATWWLPEPQRQWIDAYAKFLGSSPRIGKLLSYIPSPIKYASIPAIANAPLLPLSESEEKYPVLIFSHGLGGFLNAYSAIIGSLASCGVICFAPEHRDQSAPMSIVRAADGTTKIIPYLILSHTYDQSILEARNAQLRIRLWEVELLYTAIQQLDQGGRSLTNFLASTGKDDHGGPSFENMLDLRPGKVTWAGHSFGAASMVQFVKSVYWHQSVPSSLEIGNDGTFRDWKPLYTPTENSALRIQVTCESPLVLLDLWAMPLRGPTTAWLWEKPLPCYAIHNTSNDKNQNPHPDSTSSTSPADISTSSPSTTPQPNSPVLAIMSAEFYKWTELLQRTKTILSAHPGPSSSSLNTTTNNNKTTNQPSSPKPTTQTPSNPAPAPTQPRLFYAPQTAHLSQSDFGTLFPWLTKYIMKADDPEHTILLNVRAVLQLLRERGMRVRSVVRNKNNSKDEKDKDKNVGDVNDDDPDILSTDAKVKGWVPLSL